jgi:hypothetical protein
MFKSDLHILLNAFEPIGLNEMDSVKLMNRVETKYLFSVNKLPELLSKLDMNYRVLETDQLRTFPYHTTYLDTSDYLFFRHQMTGKLSRYKVRFRRYVSSGISYLEIKKKTNKNRTIKWRIRNYSESNHPDSDATKFIIKHLPFKELELAPVLINRFTRITLVGKTLNERLTLDYNLEFASPGGNEKGLPFLAIAELKRDGFSSHSPFVAIMKQFGIHPNGFSKYCIGNSIVRQMPRTNILKSKILLINKIENEFN